MSFRAACCNKLYDALPASIDLKYFQLTQENANMDNVRILHRKKK